MPLKREGKNFLLNKVQNVYIRHDLLPNNDTSFLQSVIPVIMDVLGEESNDL